MVCEWWCRKDKIAQVHSGHHGLGVTRFEIILTNIFICVTGCLCETPIRVAFEIFGRCSYVVVT